MNYNLDNQQSRKFGLKTDDIVLQCLRKFSVVLTILTLLNHSMLVRGRIDKFVIEPQESDSSTHS